MSANTSTEVGSPRGHVALERLVSLVGQAERHIAEAVVLAGELSGCGVAERSRGDTLEGVLAASCRLTGADRATLIAAGETLQAMPVLRELFVDGKVSWGQVRAIVGRCKRLSQAHRRWVDDRLATTVAERGGVAAFDPDELVWAVDAAVDECTASGEDSVERQQRDSFVAVQPDLLGGCRGYFELDATKTAVVVGALDAAASPPRREDDLATGDPESDSQADAASGSGWTPSGRARQYAGALEAICSHWLAGSPAADDGDEGDDAVTRRRPARRARPLVLVHVDWADVTDTTGGILQLPVRGQLPRLRAAAVEALVCAGADVRCVLWHRKRPLTVTAKRRANQVPADVRLAVEARDRGCRWLGCAEPVSHCDTHHLVAQAEGGDHHVDLMVLLCRRHHTMAHEKGWTLTLDASSGQLTARRGRRRRWQTLPHATPLAEADAHPRGNVPRDARGAPGTAASLDSPGESGPAPRDGVGPDPPEPMLPF